MDITVVEDNFRLTPGRTIHLVHSIGTIVSVPHLAMDGVKSSPEKNRPIKYGGWIYVQCNDIAIEYNYLQAEKKNYGAN